MNDLKELLTDRASTIKPPVVDYDAITRVGNQRVRRRRAVGVGATAFVLAGAVIAAPLVLRSSGPDKDSNAFAANEAKPLTWAKGNVIHAGAASVDVGHRVSLFVEAGDGYVFADDAQRVWHWADGHATEVGHLATENGTQLISNSGRVAWVDDAAKPTSFAVLDTADNKLDREIVEPIPRPDEFNRPSVSALDGDQLYAEDGRGALRITVGSAEPPTVLISRADLPPAFRVYDAEGGLMLFGDEVDTEHGEATYLSSSLSQPGARLPISGGNISPGGGYVMSENSATESDHFTLLDVGTGKALTPDAAADYAYFNGYAWRDGDTYSAIGLKQTDQAPYTVDLLLCTVGESCTLSKEQPPAWPVQLPIGAHID